MNNSPFILNNLFRGKDMSIGHILKLIRTNNGLNQKQMAERLEISQNYLSLIESEKRQPSPDLYESIADSLEVSKDALIFAASEAPEELNKKDREDFLRLQNNIIALLVFQLTGNLKKLLRLYRKTKLNINTKKHLALRLGFPIEELEEVAKKAEDLYRFKEERKDSGGIRLISAPKPRLKRIQKSIHRLLQEIEISPAAHGGVIGRSNLTNAREHCGKKYLLTLDFKNFFPNISHYIVYKLFHKDLGCAPPVASLLTRLTTVKRQVPQGGPMSTDIANLVLRDMDLRVKRLMKQNGISYSRFVDDIAISGNEIPGSLIKKLLHIISQSGFELNPQKGFLRDGHLYDETQPKLVTGLSVHRKKPNVPREKRRQVRSEEFILTKHLLKDINEEDYLIKYRKIRGKLSYIDYINKNR
jgi:RNA-directed DNA polymerase